VGSRAPSIEEKLMRRLFTSTGGAVLITLVLAGTALGAHCQNESKQADAGQHVVVTVNTITGGVTFDGTNAAGRLTGGFADIWLDFDGDGTGDLLACNDVFLVSNHSGQAAPGQTEAEGAPGALPPIIRGQDPGGDGSGLTSCGG
jgi:hypothetical protein